MPKMKFNIQPQSKERKNIKPEITNTENRNLTLASEILNQLEKRVEQMPFNIKFIARDKIVTNDKNTFAQVDIEKIADSILNLGLIHNLEAIYDEENDVYILESGERRLRALDLLIEKYKNFSTENSDSNVSDEKLELYKLYQKNVAGFEKGYPVNVKRFLNDDEDDRLKLINSELRLIAANHEVRPDDPQIRLINIERYNNLLKEKNSLLPKGLKVNIDKTISELENISDRQVRKYKDILTLVPELQEEFKRNNITLSEGSAYSGLTEEEQYALLKLIKSGEKVKANEIKAIKEAFDKNQVLLKEKENELTQQNEKILMMQQEQKKLNDTISKHNDEVAEIRNNFEKQKETIRKQLEEELKKENINNEEVTRLQQDLNSIKENHAKEIAEGQKKLQEKEAEIEELQKKYDEYIAKVAEQNKDNELTFDKTMKEAQLRLKIEASIDELTKVFENISNYYSQISYTNTVNQNITSAYSKEIAALVKKYRELYMI